MMMLKDVMAVLDTIAPFEAAETWDNVGLMVGDQESPINSVLVALDPSLEVIHTAKEGGIDLILTHHPLILKPLARIDLQEVIAKKIAMLILTRINLISMHTNLDKAPGGVADELAKRLALSDVRPHGYMRIGFINKPTTMNEWITAMSIRDARLIDNHREVSMVAVCPGSGMEYWKHALSLGCDTFVTGDVRYHAGLDAKEAGMNVVDLGHFGTEEIIVAPLAERLKQELKGVAIHAHQGRDVFSPYNN
jgi:GTP cyclohydrolase I